MKWKNLLRIKKKKKITNKTHFVCGGTSFILDLSSNRNDWSSGSTSCEPWNATTVFIYYLLFFEYVCFTIIITKFYTEQYCLGCASAAQLLSLFIPTIFCIPRVNLYYIRVRRSTAAIHMLGGRRDLTEEVTERERGKKGGSLTSYLADKKLIR